MLYAIDLRDLTMKHADDTYCQSKKALIASGSVSTLELNLGFFQLIQEQAHLRFVPDSIRDILLMVLSLIPFIFFRGLNIQYAVYKTETGDQNWR